MGKKSQYELVMIDKIHRSKNKIAKMESDLEVERALLMVLENVHEVASKTNGKDGEQ